MKKMPSNAGLLRGFISCSTLAMLGVSVASACCGVGPRGKPIRFGDQTNIVIWDPANKIEHFIRDAKFESDAPDFGFIAPSPSKPELSEASDAAFETLAALKPFNRMSCSGPEAVGAIATSKSLQVIQQVDVAGYRATTLLASDSGALAEWMRKNGYQTTPTIEAWTKVYIAKGWYLTAFKVLDDGPVASTGTVRMSFTTDAPFNPYYVPADNIKSGRTGMLKVFFVAPGEYRATIGKGQPWESADWTAPLPDATSSRLAGQLKLPPSAIPPGAHVEEFQDPEFPRAASDDIYFSVKPPNYLGDVVGFAAVIGIGVLLWRRLFRSPKPSPA
jgi:hypothetical protein